MAYHNKSHYHQQRGGDEDKQHDSVEYRHSFPELLHTEVYKKVKPRPLTFLFLFSLIFFGLLYLFHLIFASSSTPLPLSGLFGKQQHIIGINSNSASQAISEASWNEGPCSSMPNNSICCDRTSNHTDVCFMRGDVRFHPSSSSIILYSGGGSTIAPKEEKIRPYTRKWENAIRHRIHELRLRTGADIGQCDIIHDIPALVFSAGGYTGNLFHAFNNGIVPLYITSQNFNRRVVLVVLQYRHWWYTKYREILSSLSDYPPIDFFNDTRTHCFPRAVVGLRFHGTLAIEPHQMIGNKTIVDFHQMLERAYKKPQIKSTREDSKEKSKKPKLVIMSRKGSRTIENEDELVKLGEEIGFRVEILRPNKTMELARIYQVLSSCDAMIGVHGAALTHFLFMRPGSAFIQIVPLGIDELARSCFGDAAVKMGLQYEEYKILPRESSLYREYEKDDLVLQDPRSVIGKGWEVTKEIYLERQNVSLDLSRLHDPLVRAFRRVV